MFRETSRPVDPVRLPGLIETKTRVRRTSRRNEQSSTDVMPDCDMDKQMKKALRSHIHDRPRGLAEQTNGTRHAERPTSVQQEPRTMPHFVKQPNQSHRQEEHIRLDPRSVARFSPPGNDAHRHGMIAYATAPASGHGNLGKSLATGVDYYARPVLSRCSDGPAQPQPMLHLEHRGENSADPSRRPPHYQHFEIADPNRSSVTMACANRCDGYYVDTQPGGYYVDTQPGGYRWR